MVGAPIGKNLQPKTNQSGALYKCPLTSYHDDCVQVVTDGKRSKYTSFFILKNIYIVNYIKFRNIKGKKKNPSKNVSLHNVWNDKIMVITNLTLEFGYLSNLVKYDAKLRKVFFIDYRLIQKSPWHTVSTLLMFEPTNNRRKS